MTARDRTTRAKTKPGRLRRLDAWLLAAEDDLLHRRDGAWAHAPLVDVGLGATPATTVELAEAVQRAGWPPVVGVDVAPRRVAHAARTAGRPGLVFREGGFDLPLEDHERPRLVRAMNLLRQYRPQEVEDAWRRMATPLLPGGLLVEGTTDRSGAIGSAWLLRRDDDGLVREGLWISTDGSHGFAPRMVRDWLPRDVRRDLDAVAGVRDLLDAWQEAWAEDRARHPDRPPVEAFAGSAERLAHQRHDVDASRAGAGHLLWRPCVPRVTLPSRSVP